MGLERKDLLTKSLNKPTKEKKTGSSTHRGREREREGEREREREREGQTTTEEKPI